MALRSTHGQMGADREQIHFDAYADGSCLTRARPSATRSRRTGSLSPCAFWRPHSAGHLAAVTAAFGNGGAQGRSSRRASWEYYEAVWDVSRTTVSAGFDQRPYAQPSEHFNIPADGY